MDNTPFVCQCLMNSHHRLGKLMEAYQEFKDDCHEWEEDGEDEFMKECLIKDLHWMRREYQAIHDEFNSKVLFEPIPPFLDKMFLETTTLLAELKRLLF